MDNDNDAPEIKDAVTVLTLGLTPQGPIVWMAPALVEELQAKGEDGITARRIIDEAIKATLDRVMEVL